MSAVWPLEGSALKGLCRRADGRSRRLFGGRSRAGLGRSRWARRCLPRTRRCACAPGFGLGTSVFRPPRPDVGRRCLARSLLSARPLPVRSLVSARSNVATVVRRRDSVVGVAQQSDGCRPDAESRLCGTCRANRHGVDASFGAVRIAWRSFSRLFQSGAKIARLGGFLGIGRLLPPLLDPIRQKTTLRRRIELKNPPRRSVDKGDWGGVASLRSRSQGQQC